MCSCVGGTISGAIGTYSVKRQSSSVVCHGLLTNSTSLEYLLSPAVLVTGHFAQRHRVANNYDDDATDLDVVKNMLLAFILSYTLLFTVMEPLRAAIKAVYVAFAQNPRSLSHAYPLIYHRLTRLSEANLS